MPKRAELAAAISFCFRLLAYCLRDSRLAWTQPRALRHRKRSRMAAHADGPAGASAAAKHVSEPGRVASGGESGASGPAFTIVSERVVYSRWVRMLDRRVAYPDGREFDYDVAATSFFTLAVACAIAHLDLAV